MAALPLVCLIANLTAGVPGFTFQDLYLNIYTVDRVACPGIQENEVTFHLFSRTNPEVSDILIPNNDQSIANSNINFEKPTVIFFHGFMEGYDSVVSQTVKKAYLAKDDYNVILVDAKLLYAGPNYITAANNVQAVGEYTAEFLDYLVTQGLNLKDLTVSGMSLGGQTTGIVGSSIKSGKLPKIIAYDPAGPLFNYYPESRRLDASDAEFVIVIHSSPTIFGYSKKCGHLDFWINGSPLTQAGCLFNEATQRKPGCLPELVFCSHYLSYRLGAYGVNHPKEFAARNCTTYEEYLDGRCNNNDLQYIGGNVMKSVFGDYFITITSDVYSKIL